VSSFHENVHENDHGNDSGNVHDWNFLDWNVHENVPENDSVVMMNGIQIVTFENFKPFEFKISRN
jgi:hypothetical protein